MFLNTPKWLLCISKELRYRNIKLLRAGVLGCEVREIGGKRREESMKPLNMLEARGSSDPPASLAKGPSLHPGHTKSLHHIPIFQFVTIGRYCVHFFLY